MFFSLILVSTIVLSHAKINPIVVNHAKTHDKISVLLYMSEQADLTPPAAIANDRNMLGAFVHKTLKDTAKASQAPLLQELRSLSGISNPRSYAVANVIAIDVDTHSDLLHMLAERDDIRAIEPNMPFAVSLESPGQFEQISRFNRQTDDVRDGGDEGTTKTDDSLEWNLEWINVPYAWNTSYRGEGQIYANADTGVHWTHETLKDNYYGNKGDGKIDHNYGWWDGVKKALTSGEGPCGINSQQPCDDNGHGTHTTSTSVGSHGVGVAPGSRWMACRNMDRGFGSSETYLNCLEFFMAPTDLEGKSPNPELRPHAIGNSYGCPSSEGCARNAFTRAVQNLRKAGIFMSVSAGNEGPGCSTIDSPPGYEPAVISVGATSKMSPKITYFSSRGPSYHLGADKAVRKPDVTAPGSLVRAAYLPRRGFPGLPPPNPNNNYATLSGTSMASPHVGGAVLILTQACPCLARDIDAIQDLLQSTAQHYTTGAPETKASACGGDRSNAVPNNVYGYGGIDLQPALKKCFKTCSEGKQ